MHCNFFIEMNSSTLKDLKERATTIRDEVKRKANTAERVGSLLYDLVDKFGIELADENRAVLQYDSFDDFPVPGSDNSIYIDLATNRIYRWDSNSDEYVTVSSTTASGGVVTHCVVIDDDHTVSSIDELPEASADNLNSVYMVRDGESAYAQLYYSRMKIRASYPRKMIYTWDADCEHSVLCGDWLTEGWEYLTNDATGALTNTQPEETATYIDDNTGNFYVYNSQTNTFSQISNEEVIDSSTTIYIDCNRSPLKTAAASALAGYKKEGTYNVIAIERSQTNCYTFTVERSLDYYRQYLVGRDGYYYRTNEPIDGTGDGSTWSVWKDYSYAFLTDLSNSDTQVEANTSNIATNTSNIATNTAAIADLTTKIDYRNRSYTLDLAADCEQAQDWNLLGAITITTIRTQNVSAITYRVGETTPVLIELTLQDDGSYLWTGEIAVPDSTLVVWNVTKAADGIAAVGVTYK